MIDPKTILDHVCKSKGYHPFDEKEPHDPFELQLLLKTSRQAWRWVDEYRQKHCKGLYPIYFHCIESPRLNAFAFYEGVSKTGFVGVRTGAVLLIYDIFYRVLSHPKTLPSIGNPSMEVFQKHLYVTELSDDFSVVCQRRKTQQDSFTTIIPKCPQRRHYAEMLAEIALEFLILHEIAHLAAGHCEYSNSKQKNSGNPFVLEEFGPGAPGAVPLEEQWFEVAADALSADASYLRRLHRPTDEEKITRSKYDKRPAIVEPEELLMFDWVFAVAFLFWMFGINTDPNSLNTEEHPPALLRLILTNAHISEMLKRHASDDMQARWEKGRMRAGHEADDSLASIGAKRTVKKQQVYYQMALDGTFRKHFERVNAAGEQIEPEVRKFIKFDYFMRIPTPPGI